MKLKIIQFFCFVLCLAMSMSGVLAQNATVTAGGTATGSGGTLTFTVGQIADQKVEGGSQYIIEGVQQPYEIQIVGVDNYSNISLEAMVYPNPTVDMVNLRLVMDNMDFPGEIRVFDLEGKYLFSKKIESENTEISMSSFAQGVYFVNVYDNGQMLKSFKVVKTNN